MPYEAYKLMHFAAIFTTLAMIGATFIGTVGAKKWVKILSGITSALILVSGMGMMARLGISISAGLPRWILLKMGLWLCLAVGLPILSKRVETFRVTLGLIAIGLMCLAAYFVVNRP